MQTHELDSARVVALSVEEMVGIEGGGGPLYWLSYGIGYAAHFLYNESVKQIDQPFAGLTA